MLRLEHRPTRFDQPHGGPELVEIVTPRTNAAALSAAEHLFAALVGSRGLALELAGDAAPQADPLLGVFAALGDLPPGWRALAQLVLWPAPADWARPHLRRSIEHALEPERAAAAGTSRSSGWAAW